jgi:hypothetical protein
MFRLNPSWHLSVARAVWGILWQLESPMTERRELYRSPNGDTWFLGREPTSGNAFIIHQPNAPSGGRLSHIELGEFLRAPVKGPQHQALLRLIGTLVNVPPYA